MLFFFLFYRKSLRGKRRELWWIIDISHVKNSFLPEIFAIFVSCCCDKRNGSTFVIGGYPMASARKKEKKRKKRKKMRGHWDISAGLLISQANCPDVPRNRKEISVITPRTEAPAFRSSVDLVFKCISIFGGLGNYRNFGMNSEISRGPWIRLVNVASILSSFVLFSLRPLQIRFSPPLDRLHRGKDIRTEVIDE